MSTRALSLTIPSALYEPSPRNMLLTHKGTLNAERSLTTYGRGVSLIVTTRHVICTWSWQRSRISDVTVKHDPSNAPQAQVGQGQGTVGANDHAGRQ